MTDLQMPTHIATIRGGKRIRGPAPAPNAQCLMSKEIPISKVARRIRLLGTCIIGASLIIGHWSLVIVCHELF